MGDFFETGIVIWAGIRLKKRVWADYEQLLRVVFSCFQGQKKFKNIVASALKSYIK